MMVTAGSPKFKNCQILKANLGVTGFCGHVGDTQYPMIRTLDERGEAEAFNAKSN